MKPKMNVDNKACVEGEFKKLIVISLLLAVFAPLILAFIGVAADSIASSSQARLDDLAADNITSGGLVDMYSLLANDFIVEIVLIAVFIFVVVFALLSFIKTKKSR